MAKEVTVVLLDPAEAIACPVRQILGRVGGRWALDVIFVLSSGRSHFGQLLRSIPGVSRRMLTVTLRGLERDGIISRDSSGVAGDMVHYELTPLGQTLAPYLVALSEWSRVHRAEIESARALHDKLK